jgi:hypothetical protein
MAKFARCPFARTTANCSNSFCHFHLIMTVSRPQQHLICLWMLWYHFLSVILIIVALLLSLKVPYSSICACAQRSPLFMIQTV